MNNKSDQEIDIKNKISLDKQIDQVKKQYNNWTKVKEKSNIKSVLFSLWGVIFPVFTLGYSLIKYTPEYLPGKAFIKGFTSLYPSNLITLGIISGIGITTSVTLKVISNIKIKKINSELKRMHQTSLAMNQSLAKIKGREKGNDIQLEEHPKEVIPVRVESTVSSGSKQESNKVKVLCKVYQKRNQ